MDYSYERHQGCKYFCQCSWMYAEGKYICTKTGKLYFLQEIPEGCIKGFKKFLYPEPVEEYKPKIECKIYKFKPK